MIKDSLIVSSTTIITLLFGLVGQYFLAHYLNLNAYGSYQYILSWIALLSFFSLPSFNAIVIKAVSQGYSRFFRRNNQIRFFFSLLGSLILIGVGFFLKPKYFTLFCVSSFFFPFYCGLNATNSYLFGKKAFKTHAILNISSQFIIILGVISVAIIFSTAEASITIFLLLTSLYYIVSTLYFHQKEKHHKINKNKEEYLVNYGFQLTGVSVIGLISDKIQFIILENTAGTITLAIYAAAQLFPDRIKSVVKSLFNPISIYLSASNKEDGLKFLRKSLVFFFLFGLLLFLLSLVFLPILIKIVFGSNYNTSVFYSIVLNTTIIFIPVNTIITAFVIFHSYKHFYLFISLFRSISKILMFIVLIPKFQISGIVYSILLVELFTSLIYTFWLFRILKLKSIYEIRTFEFNSTSGNHFISKKLNGNNLIQVLKSDEIKGKKIPLWAKLLGKISSTKFS